MLTKLKRKVLARIRRRESEAEWRGFIAGMQYGEYIAKKEMKTE